MTAVTQTDAFNKLDESTLKDFIAKVSNLLPQIGLSDSVRTITKVFVECISSPRFSSQIKLDKTSLYY